MAVSSYRSYQTYYPHPTHGLDVQAARERVLASPEVMPPQPKPLRYRRWRLREVFGLRLHTALLIAAVGLLGPPLLRRLFGSRRPRRLARNGRVPSGVLLLNKDRRWRPGARSRWTGASRWLD